MKTQYICDECGLELSAEEYEKRDDILCPECGGQIAIRQTPERHDLQATSEPPPDPMVQYPPGMGKGSPIPPEIRGWNWGAFLMNILWGLKNGVYWQAMLTLVPVVGTVMVFVLGAKGNKWAWQNRNWESVESFKNVQKKWAIAGFLLTFVTIFFLVFMTMRSVG